MYICLPVAFACMIGTLKLLYRISLPGNILYEGSINRAVTISCDSGVAKTVFRFSCLDYTYVAAVALTPLTTHPHMQVELERSSVSGQEQPNVSPLPS